MRSLQRLLTLVCLSAATVAWAQVDRGTITGTVSDSSGAVIPQTTVFVRNTATGARYTGITDTAGVYSIPNLPVGRYDVHFSQQGFRPVDRTGLDIETGKVARIDIVLQVGNTAESVTVAANAVLLDTENGTQGSNVDVKAVQDLPLTFYGGRDAEQFAFNTAPGADGNNWDSHIEGSPGMSKEVLIDGIEMNAGPQGFVNAPGAESLQAVSLQTNGIDAEAAGTGSGVLMYETKSGTNQIHGSAYGFLKNAVLDANSWSNNWFAAQNPSQASAYKRPVDSFHDYGFSGGGPFWKNHTFGFVDYETFVSKNLAMANGAATTPTTAFLNGDFSALLDKTVSYGTDSAGNTVYKGAIFNPATGNVFPNNVIPGNLISSQSQKILGLYQKNYAPTIAGNLVNNYPGLIGQPSWDVNRWDARLDHNFSDRNHAFYAYNWYDQPIMSAGGLWQPGTTTGGPLSGGGPAGFTQDFITYSNRASDTYVITPAMVNTASWAFNKYHVGELPNNTFNPSSIGFTGFTGDVGSKENFPAINFGNSVNGIGETTIGSQINDYYQFTTWVLKDTLDWTKGRQTFKFGGEYQHYATASNRYGDIQSYNFSNLTGIPTQFLNPAIDSGLGFGFANFLLGDVQSAGMTVGNPIGSHRQGFFSFVEDSIKMTPRLTINLGVRWEVNLPTYSSNGHWTQFNINGQNPAWAPYKGAWQYASNPGTTFQTQNNFHQFAPHVGAAFKVDDKTVIRGAFGRYYAPPGQNQWVALPYGSDYGFTGINAVNNYVENATAFNWDNGYPGKTVQSTPDPNSTYLGTTLAYNDPNYLSLGHTNNWSIGVERQVAKDMYVSVSWLANHGRNFHESSLDPLNFPSQAAYQALLKSGHINDPVNNAQDAAAAGVPYPYAGFTGYAYQTIFPYPQAISQGQFINVVGSNHGRFDYNGLAVEVKKRAGIGLTMDMSYTYSKATTNMPDFAWDENGAYQNFQNPYAYNQEAKVVAPFDETHIVKGYLLYDLPFGKGRPFLSGAKALNYLVGGWTVGASLRYNTGQPMGAINAGFSYPGWPAVYANLNPGASLANTFRNVNLAWNGAPGTDPNGMFFNPASFSNPAFGDFGNQPRLYNNWRTWGYADEDASLLKHFGFGPEGRYRLTLRAEFFNLFNRHYFGSPNTDITSPYFGHITSMAGYSPRQGQVGARFDF